MTSPEQQHQQLQEFVSLEQLLPQEAATLEQQSPLQDDATLQQHLQDFATSQQQQQQQQQQQPDLSQEEINYSNFIDFSP